MITQHLLKSPLFLKNYLFFATLVALPLFECSAPLNLCQEASIYISSCMPDYTPKNNLECTTGEEAQAETILNLSCQDLLQLMQDGKLDDSLGTLVDPQPALLEAQATCAPQGDVCGQGSLVQGLFATFRKDFYLPEDRYYELNPTPTHGGRFQVAAIAQASGKVTKVLLDGTDLETALEDPSIKNEDNPVEWFHVWPDTLAVGEPVWVAFHSRSAKWDQVQSAQLTIETSEGTAVNGSIPVQTTKVPLTYVTTSKERDTFLIHLKNMDDTAHRVTRLLLNGRDVTASDIACIPQKSIAPGHAVLFSVPLCQAATLGDPWTVVVEFENSPPTVGVGRVIKPFFPIESYTNTSQCPFPGGKDDNYRAYREAGLDTFYLHNGVGSAENCNIDLQKLVSETLPNTTNLYVLAASHMSEQAFTNTERIAGFETGDESDGSIYLNETESSNGEGQSGKPKAWSKAKASNQAWSRYKEIPTFNGGKTNKNVGTFAGIADIQGMDFYVAACAPHITEILSPMHIFSAYDYLRNARENHMPHPTWLYTQGLHSGWNAKRPLIGGTVHVQPDPQELLIQGMSVIAAGGKGIMWFQTTPEEMQHSPKRWQAISQLNWMVRGVREYLREGDITQMVQSSDGVLAEMIHAPNALVVLAINIKEVEPINDECNVYKYLEESFIPHWKVQSLESWLKVYIPDDFRVMEAFEVLDGQTVDIASENLEINGRALELKNISLSNTIPVRMYVIAGSHTVREEVSQAMLLD